MELTLRDLKRSELDSVRALLKKSFQYDYALHHPQATKEEIATCMLPEFEEKYFKEDNYHSFVVIDADATMVGCVIVAINPDQNNELELFFFDPDQVSHGIGTQVWKRIEAAYPDTKNWTTHTPYYSRRNIYFYLHKCGFSITEIEDPRNEEWAFLKFEKHMCQGLQ